MAYTRGSYPTEKITVTFIDFESLEIINEEITPSKTSELMMKVSVSVELKEISTEDLQNELLSRQREIYDIEKDFYMEGVCIHHIHMLCIKERPYHELYDYVLYYKHHLKKDIIKP